MQAVQAAQITFEDFFLSSMDVPALKIVGFEGLWGAGAMLLVLLPIVQRLPGKDGTGLHEDSVDTLHVRRAPAQQSQPKYNLSFTLHPARAQPLQASRRESLSARTDDCCAACSGELMSV